MSQIDTGTTPRAITAMSGEIVNIITATPINIDTTTMRVCLMIDLVVGDICASQVDGSLGIETATINPSLQTVVANIVQDVRVDHVDGGRLASDEETPALTRGGVAGHV